jgi:molecular chaperone GrpE
MSDEQKDNPKEQEIIYNNSDETGEIDAGHLKEKNIELKERLERCREEKQEYLTGWQREKADFINFKRRQEEQMAEWITMSHVGLIKELLPVLDSIEQGIKNWVKTEETDINHLSIIKEQIMEVLRKNGLEEIKAIGVKFDPVFHEAIEQIESEEEGVIVEEVQKGYVLNGKVLRTSKVRVSK